MSEIYLRLDYAFNRKLGLCSLCSGQSNVIAVTFFSVRQQEVSHILALNWNPPFPKDNRRVAVLLEVKCELVAVTVLC